MSLSYLIFFSRFLRSFIKFLTHLSLSLPLSLLLYLCSFSITFPFFIYLIAISILSPSPTSTTSPFSLSLSHSSSFLSSFTALLSPQSFSSLSLSSPPSSSLTLFHISSTSSLVCTASPHIRSSCRRGTTGRDRTGHLGRLLRVSGPVLRLPSGSRGPHRPRQMQVRGFLSSTQSLLRLATCGVGIHILSFTSLFH